MAKNTGVLPVIRKYFIELMLLQDVTSDLHASLLMHDESC